MRAAVFAASFAAMIAGHQVGDYWIQTSRQAARKGLPGWPGRLACAGHVGSYTLTVAAFILAAEAVLGLRLSWPWLLGGLAVSAVTHYIADRRKPLEWLALSAGKFGFYRAGEGLATGAALLDQAWHWAWLFVSALIVSGGAR